MGPLESLCPSDVKGMILIGFPRFAELFRDLWGWGGFVALRAVINANPSFHLIYLEIGKGKTYSNMKKQEKTLPYKLFCWADTCCNR